MQLTSDELKTALVEVFLSDFRKPGFPGYPGGNGLPPGGSSHFDDDQVNLFAGIAADEAGDEQVLRAVNLALSRKTE